MLYAPNHVQQGLVTNVQIGQPMQNYFVEALHSHQVNSQSLYWMTCKSILWEYLSQAWKESSNASNDVWQLSSPAVA
jgi:hypothetical protein